MGYERCLEGCYERSTVSPHLDRAPRALHADAHAMRPCAFRVEVHVHGERGLARAIRLELELRSGEYRLRDGNEVVGRQVGEPWSIVRNGRPYTPPPRALAGPPPARRRHGAGHAVMGAVFDAINRACGAI